MVFFCFCNIIFQPACSAARGMGGNSVIGSTLQQVFSRAVLQGNAENILRAPEARAGRSSRSPFRRGTAFRETTRRQVRESYRSHPLLRAQLWRLPAVEASFPRFPQPFYLLYGYEKKGVVRQTRALLPLSIRRALFCQAFSFFFFLEMTTRPQTINAAPNVPKTATGQLSWPVEIKGSLLLKPSTVKSQSTSPTR